MFSCNQQSFGHVLLKVMVLGTARPPLEAGPGLVLMTIYVFEVPNCEIPKERKPPEGSSKKSILGICFSQFGSPGMYILFSHRAIWRIETSRLSAPDGMAQSSCLSHFETAYSVQCLVFHSSIFSSDEHSLHDEFAHGSIQTFLSFSFLITSDS